MRWYLDASVALHAVLPTSDYRVRTWLDARLAAEDEMFSSTLLELELTRTMRREGLELTRTRMVLDRVRLVSIEDGILRVAASIESHVKPLDAIHLATCLLLGSGVTVATHDENRGRVAVWLGMDSFDPLSPRAAS